MDTKKLIFHLEENFLEFLIPLHGKHLHFSIEIGLVSLKAVNTRTP